MVTGNDTASNFYDEENEIEVLNSPIKYCSVSLSEIFNKGKRLEASVFDIEAKQALDDILNCKFPYLPLIGDNSFVIKAFYGGRIKRRYVKAESNDAIGFIGSSEMLDCYPKPVKYMSKSDNIQAFQVSYGDLLISRSGTIGNLTFVGKTLEKLLVSEHAIRLECNEYPGYVYIFLKSHIGQLLIKSHIYGAVIQEIEPAHLASIPIPNPPVLIKKYIHDLIIKSYELRDESNLLIDEATELLIQELNFPKIQDFNLPIPNKNIGISTFNVKLSDMNGRVDASYHIPLVDTIKAHMELYAKEVTIMGDTRISKNVILPP